MDLDGLDGVTTSFFDISSFLFVVVVAESAYLVLMLLLLLSATGAFPPAGVVERGQTVSSWQWKCELLLLTVGTLLLLLLLRV